MKTKLYVGNIPYNATSEELYEHFSTAGRISKVDRLTERQKGRNRGFAFIDMQSNNDAVSAVEQLGGKEFQGRNLRIVIARPYDD